MLFLVAFLLVTASIFFVGTSAGFCPMDEGLVLAQAHRLLLGQTPHLDFVTPRPALSPILHLVDRLLPMPMLRGSRLLAVLEIATYTAVLAALVYRAGPRRWTFVQVVGWVIALLVNVHGFPIMAWYTIDGILLVALGFALVHRDAERWPGPSAACGLILLGAAPLTKQSFFVAPLIGIVQFVTGDRGRLANDRLRTVLQGLAFVALPALLYVSFVGMRGGLAALLDQLLGAQPTWGAALLGQVQGPTRATLLQLATVLVATTICDLIARRDGRAAPFALLTALGLRVAVSVILLMPALTLELSWERAGWGGAIWWRSAVVLAWGMLLDRAAAGVAIVLLLLGWMTSLSWGYANPNLVVGSVALAAACFVWRDAPDVVGPLRRPVEAVSLVLAVVALLAASSAFVAARSRPYFDRPAVEAVVDLGTISPALGGIRANPTTAALLRDLIECIARHPARRVAVIPDNAWIYPSLGLDNPLPLDWLYPPEYRSDPSIVLRRVAQLDEEGDYLVLFQPEPAHVVCRRQEPLPQAGRTFQARGYGDGLPFQILGKLTGRRVRCGSVAGRWRPASTVAPASAGSK